MVGHGVRSLGHLDMENWTYNAPKNMNLEVLKGNLKSRRREEKNGKKGNK